MATGASVSSADVINLFKQVYGDLTDLTPNDQHLSRLIPFSQKQKVGESYLEAIVLTSETGFTLSASTSAFDLNPPRAGVVAQSSVVPYISVLSSIVPWGVISRSAGGGVRSFYDATKFIVRNNLKSHEKLQEILRFYGQAPALLGYVSYYTGLYRGVNFTNGTGTLNGYSFTGGVTTTPDANGYYAILLAPGSFASGIWVAMEGVKVLEIGSIPVVEASGTLKGVNSEYGYILVDFAPTQATTLAPVDNLEPETAITSNVRLCFDGMQNSEDYIGINKILTTSGSLFGINTSQYSLWQGSTLDLLYTAPLTLQSLQQGVANMVNKSGMEGDLTCFVNPRSWSTLSNNDAALRMFDQSYKPKMDEAGWEQITYYSQNGKITIVPHRMVKEGEAYALFLPVWSRSGSAEVSFIVPGMPHEVIFPLQNQAGYAFRSYADQYIFCHAPAQNLFIKNINDQLTS